MRATRCSKKFAPVTITLETDEECRYLWHLLNSNPAFTFKDYAAKKKYVIDSNLAREIWETLDEVFTARKE